MRLAAIALVAAACSGSSGDRPASPAPAAEPGAMERWKQLDVRGRDYPEKLASIPEELRRPMAIAFLRDGNLTCPTVLMSVPCGDTEPRMPAVLPGADLDDACLRRQIARWALDQLDGETIARELPAVAKQLASTRPPEVELPRLLIEKVTDPALLTDLIGIVKSAGHDELADGAIDRVPADRLRILAFEHGVDAAYEAIAFDVMDDEDVEKVWRRYRGHARLRVDTRVRLIERYAAHVADPGQDGYLARWQIISLANDCPTQVAAIDVLEGVDPHLAQQIAERDGWHGRACVALRREGASSPAFRDLISKDGLKIDRYSDHPNDDDEDRVWSERKKNDESFKMPFAEELVNALSGCRGTECHVPGTTIRFQFQLSPDEKKLEAIERYERLGGC